MSKVEIVELIPLQKKIRTVLTGFAGTGFVGSSALMYIARNNRFDQVGYIRSEKLPPMMLIVDGSPKHSFRIYTDKESDLIFLITESIIPSEASWPICNELIKWLKEKGVKEFISLDGFPFAPTTQKAFSFTTGAKDFSQYGIQATGEAAISGLNACLLDKAMHYGITWTSIFVPSRAIEYVDYQGTADAIDILNHMFKLGVDPGPLRKMAESIMRGIDQRRQQQQQQPKRGFFEKIF